MDRASPFSYEFRLNKNHPGSSFFLQRRVSEIKTQKLTVVTFEYADMSEYDETLDDDNADDEDVSLPFTLKVILFSLLMVAFILIVFSASVGAICRIQCKVGDETF